MVNHLGMFFFFSRAIVTPPIVTNKGREQLPQRREDSENANRSSANKVF